MRLPLSWLLEYAAIDLKPSAPEEFDRVSEGSSGRAGPGNGAGVRVGGEHAHDEPTGVR